MLAVSWLPFQAIGAGSAFQHAQHVVMDGPSGRSRVAPEKIASAWNPGHNVLGLEGATLQMGPSSSRGSLPKLSSPLPSLQALSAVAAGGPVPASLASSLQSLAAQFSDSTCSGPVPSTPAARTEAMKEMEQAQKRQARAAMLESKVTPAVQDREEEMDPAGQEHDVWRDPTPEEQQGGSWLVGKRVRVYWELDGRLCSRFAQTHLAPSSYVILRSRLLHLGQFSFLPVVLVPIRWNSALVTKFQAKPGKDSHGQFGPLHKLRLKSFFVICQYFFCYRALVSERGWDEQVRRRFVQGGLRRIYQVAACRNTR